MENNEVGTKVQINSGKKKTLHSAPRAVVCKRNYGFERGDFIKKVERPHLGVRAKDIKRRARA
jgi:hypothetical protein